MKKIKITALLLGILLSASALTGCFGKDVEDNNEDSKSPESNLAVTADAGIAAYNWKYADDEVMFTVNGEPVSFAEYRYYFMNIRPEFDGGDASYWNDETEAEFSDYIVSEIKLLSALRSYCKENNIELSQADKQEISDINYESAGMTKEQYEEWLDSAYFTQELFIKNIEEQYLVQKLYESCAPDEEVKAYAQENYVRVSHILVSTRDENDLPLEGEALDEKTAFANSLYQRAIAGEDFDTLIKEYGDDPGMTTNPQGYFFTKGTMVQEFEDKSFELAEGEISEPVKTTFGYHIIKKLPLDIEAEIANKSDEYMNIVYTLGGQKGYDTIVEYANTLSVEKTDALNNLKVSNIIVSKK